MAEPLCSLPLSTPKNSTSPSPSEPKPPPSKVRHLLNIMNRVKKGTTRKSKLKRLSSMNSPPVVEADMPASSSKDQNEPRTLHAVLDVVKEKELGRNILVLAVPMIVALLSLYNPVNAPLAMRLVAIALSIGVAAIWNGILLRKTFRRISDALELIGIAFILMAFYSLVGSFLPGILLCIPVFCWLLFFLPFLLTVYRRRRTENATIGVDSTRQPDQTSNTDQQA